MAYFMLTPPNGAPPARYEVPKALTIGEQEDLLREYGMDAAGIGVVWITVRRRYPGTKPADIRECVAEMFEEEDDSLPPTFYAADSPNEENGQPTELADTGTHGSDTSTE